jgi:hypothetical protein
MGSDVVKWSARSFEELPKVGDIHMISSTSDAYPVWWKPWTWSRRPIDGRFKVVAVNRRKVTFARVDTLSQEPSQTPPSQATT